MRLAGAVDAERGNSLRRRLEDLVLKKFQISANIHQWIAQFMGHITDQFAAQLFRAAQAVGHGIEGMSKRADFTLRFDGSTLAQVALLHLASNRFQHVKRFQKCVGKHQGQQQGGEPGNENSEPE